MADETNAGGSAGPDVSRREAARQSAQREPRFTVEDLRARGADVLSEVGGFSASEVAAGLAREDDPDRELTRAEAARLIEAQRDRPVEHDDAPDQAEEG